MKVEIKPVGSRVLVEPLPYKKFEDYGIIPSHDDNQLGIVQGPTQKETIDNRSFYGGDIVIFSIKSSEFFEVDGKDLVIVPVNEIKAVIKVKEDIENEAPQNFNVGDTGWTFSLDRPNKPKKIQITISRIESSMALEGEETVFFYKTSDSEEVVYPVFRTEKELDEYLTKHE